MNPFETLVGLELWVGRNIAHNLKFVPADKFEWKAGPDAKSVKEIVAEIIGATAMVAEAIGKPVPPVDPTAIVSIETAQEAIIKATEDYAAVLGSLTAQDAEGEISMIGMTFPRAQVITMPVCEALHHHGQIAFIQTLWGDTQSHFVDMNI